MLPPEQCLRIKQTFRARAAPPAAHQETVVDSRAGAEPQLCAPVGALATLQTWDGPRQPTPVPRGANGDTTHSDKPFPSLTYKKTLTNEIGMCILHPSLNLPETTEDRVCAGKSLRG